LPAAEIAGVIIQQKRGFPHAGIGKQQEIFGFGGLVEQTVGGGKQIFARGIHAANFRPLRRIDALAMRPDVMPRRALDVLRRVKRCPEPFAQRTAVAPLFQPRHHAGDHADKAPIIPTSVPVKVSQ
jgi:hypothetical protein